MSTFLEFLVVLVTMVSAFAAAISAHEAKGARDDARKVSDEARLPQFIVWPMKRIDATYDECPTSSC